MERLGYVVVGEHLIAFHLVDGKVPRRDEDDRDVGGDVVILDPPAQLQPVEPRHHHVRKDEIRLLGDGLLIALGPVFGGDDIVSGGKQLCEVLPELRAVVHHEHEVLPFHPAGSGVPAPELGKGVVVGDVVAVLIVPVYVPRGELRASVREEDMEGSHPARDGLHPDPPGMLKHGGAAD